MQGYKIRAITLHYGDPNIDTGLEEQAFKLLEARDSVTSDIGLDVETVRLTITSKGSLREALELARELEKSGQEGVFINLGSYHLSGEDDLQRLLEIVEKGFFVSLKFVEGTWDEARLISKAFHKAASANPDYAVYMAFNPMGELLTPYYPLSTTPPGLIAVGVALLYPNYLARAWREGGFEALVEAIENAGRRALEAGERVLQYMGLEGKAYIDLSVSPWMNETVLGLIEEVAQVRMPAPGFAWGIWKVNDAIERASSSIGRERVGGFNEVQLPVAEDSKLKVRVAEGETSARDLLRLSGVCLAGLDMAVIPASVDGVAGLILDATAYSRSKGRVVGVRVIPVEFVEPGDKVFLSRFGEVPVIRL